MATEKKSAANIKRTMGEIRAEEIGIRVRIGAARMGRTTLYKMLREAGYIWFPGYKIWAKERPEGYPNSGILTNGVQS